MSPSFLICLSHDVDRVRKTYQYFTHDVRKRRLGNLKKYFSKSDPYWNFGRIMEMEERYGVRSSWYFLEETIPFRLLKPESWKLSLGRYSVKEEAISDIMRRLVSEGWEVGLHGSYRSFRDVGLLSEEKSTVEKVLGRPVTGIRQHYLNLDVPETWQLQRDAGFEYDASFGYRRGLGWKEDRLTPFYDEDSGMWVVPLSLMECNLFSEANDDPGKALEIACGLMEQAERRGAILTVLWHPHVFCEPDFEGYGWVYEEIIKEGRRRGAEFLTARDLVCRFMESKNL